MFTATLLTPVNMAHQDDPSQVVWTGAREHGPSPSLPGIYAFLPRDTRPMLAQQSALQSVRLLSI